MNAEKLKELQQQIQNEIEWAAENGGSDWTETISHWIVDLFKEAVELPEEQ